MDTMETWLRTSADDCAGTILKGVERRKKRIVLGYGSRQLDVLSRLFPTHYGTILKRVRGI